MEEHIKQDCLCHSVLDGGTHQTILFVSQYVRWRNTSNKIVCVTVMFYKIMLVEMIVIFGGLRPPKPGLFAIHN